MSLPEYGTAPIKCAKMSCAWRGREKDLAIKREANSVRFQHVCPQCGYDSYHFMTTKEIGQWLKSRNAVVTSDTVPNYEAPKITTCT